MDKRCGITQKDLMDIFYQEKQLNNEIKTHIKTCKGCSEYFESLHSIKKEMSILEFDQENNSLEIINKAFVIAELQEKRKKEKIEFSLFVLVALIIISIVISSAISGYGNVVFLLQVASLSLSPIIVPLMFIKKLRKESD